MLDVPSRRKGRTGFWYSRRKRQQARDLDVRIAREQPTARLYCRVCERTGLPTITESGPHRRADCSSCGNYIKFLPKS